MSVIFGVFNGNTTVHTVKAGHDVQYNEACIKKGNRFRSLIRFLESANENDGTECVLLYWDNKWMQADFDKEAGGFQNMWFPAGDEETASIPGPL